MKLEKIYNEKQILLNYPEHCFGKLNINIGVQNPILFLANKNQLEISNYFNLDIIEERNYDINVISFNSFVIMYVINIKAPYYNTVNNGIIIRNRIKWDEQQDTVDISVRYTFEDFHVVANKTQSCEIFCKNVTVDQKT